MDAEIVNSSTIDYRHNLPSTLKKELAEKGQLGMSFDYGTILMLHEKTFKGLYYHTYNVPIPTDKYKTFNLTEGEERGALMEFSRRLYQEFLKPIKGWQISGHEEVFRYKIIMLTQTNNGLVVTGNVEEMLVSICAMQYDETVFALSMVIEIKWAEELMKTKGKGYDQ